MKASYAKLDMANMNTPGAPPPFATRVEPGIDAAATELPAEAVGLHPLSIRWEADLTAPETGEYNLGLAADGFFRIRSTAKTLPPPGTRTESKPRSGTFISTPASPPNCMSSTRRARSPQSAARLVWSKVDLKPTPEAIAAARDADVVVAVVGITSELEGEEMQVNEDGFKGGDRTSLDLPKPEQALLEAVAAAGKPLVVVLTNGSALAVNWAKEHANAILDAWYPGEEGGAAVAETLSGRNNPAGRLPVTFYKDVSQLPPFEDYAMKGRTYRYFEGDAALSLRLRTELHHLHLQRALRPHDRCPGGQSGIR